MTWSTVFAYIVRSFIGLLNILDQNQSKTWTELLNLQTFERPKAPASTEEELAIGGVAARDEDEDLASLRL